MILQINCQLRIIILEEYSLQDNNTELIVDLQNQTITINSTGEQEHFDISSYKKTCLLNGYDDIDFLLSIKEDIQQFETQRV